MEDEQPRSIPTATPRMSKIDPASIFITSSDPVAEEPSITEDLELESHDDASQGNNVKAKMEAHVHFSDTEKGDDEKSVTSEVVVVEGVPDSHDGVDGDASGIKISVEFVEDLGDTLSKVAEAVGESGSDMAEAVKDALEEMAEAVGESGSDTVEAIKDALEEVAEAIGEPVAELAEAIEDALEDVSEAIGEPVRELVEAIHEAVAETSGEDKAEVIEDAASEVIEALEDESVDAINAIEKVIEDHHEDKKLDSPIISRKSDVSTNLSENEEINEKKVQIKVEAYPKPAADQGECKVSVSEMVAQVNTRAEDHEVSRQKQIKITLEKLKNEGDNQFAKNLLSLVKSPRSKDAPTETMVFREKKRATILKAIDVDAVDIIFDESHSKDEIKPKTASFKVKTSSSNVFESKEISNDLITPTWIQKAFSSVHGHSKSVNLESVNFEKAQNGVQNVKFSDDSGANFDWIIKHHVSNKQLDKEIFIIHKLGPKLRKFCISNTKFSKRNFAFPFLGAIFCDEKFAAFESSSGFDSIEEGESELDTLRLLLKTLARFHAINFAFQLKGDKDDVQEIQNFLNKKSEDESVNAPDFSQRFSNLLALLQNLDQGGLNLAEEVRARFSNTINKLVSDALKPTHNFNIICHGKPAPSNFKIRFSPDGSKVEDTILANFGDVHFSHPLVDVAFMLDVATDPQSEEKNNFLLQYVYYETLVSCLKSLGIDNLPDFEIMKNEFKSKRVGVSLLAAMHLVEGAQKLALKSKQGAALQGNPLANRVKALLEKITQSDKKKKFT